MNYRTNMVLSAQVLRVLTLWPSARWVHFGPTAPNGISSLWHQTMWWRRRKRPPSRDGDIEGFLRLAHVRGTSTVVEIRAGAVCHECQYREGVFIV